jgi:hypothetical protein
MDVPLFEGFAELLGQVTIQMAVADETIMRHIAAIGLSLS